MYGQQFKTDLKCVDRTKKPLSTQTLIKCDIFIYTVENSLSQSAKVNEEIQLIF